MNLAAEEDQLRFPQRLCLVSYSSTETLESKTILPHFKTVFTPAAEIASYIIHHLFVIYSLQRLVLLQIQAFNAVLSLRFLFLYHCSLPASYLNLIFFPFCWMLIYLSEFRHQASLLINDA